MCSYYIAVSEILHKSGMSRHARDFVESCLDRDKDTRSSAEILLGHDFIHKHVGKIREVDSGNWNFSDTCCRQVVHSIFLQDLERLSGKTQLSQKKNGIVQ